MRRAQIVDLAGRFGPITASGIWDLVAARGLDGLFLDIRSAKKSDLDYIRSRGLTPGVVISTTWFPTLTGAQLADKANDYLTNTLGFTGTNAIASCDVMFDNERKDMSDVLAMLQRFRYDRYKRQMWWTPEGMQGGLFTYDLRNFINGDINCGVVPEAYENVMQPRDPNAVWKDVVLTGEIDAARAKVYYGTYYQDPPGTNIKLPPLDGWDGVLFDLDHA